MTLFPNYDSLSLVRQDAAVLSGRHLENRISHIIAIFKEDLTMTNLKLTALSARNYPSTEEKRPNFGDCFLIDNGKTLCIFDCGCELHAQRVEQYMKIAGYAKAAVILSHNDADHFDGIPYLVEKGLVSEIYCHLFLKHKKEILEMLNDGRVTDHSVGERIKRVYENISSLSMKVPLKDAMTAGAITSDVKIVGPDEEYSLETVTKALKSSKTNKIDAETLVNAASIQLAVSFPQGKCLLCGDASFEAISDKLKDYSIIQLPHHGKAETAQKIFNAKAQNRNTVYLVSDNTGDTNGGSDKLNTYGKIVRNTKAGEVHYPNDMHVSPPAVRGTLGLF